MYGFVHGISETSEINYCPYCGEETAVSFSDGTVVCNECSRRFGVVETEGED